MRRLIVSLALSLVALTALMGFAHTSAGRPVLAWLGRHVKKGSCPLGMDAARTPVQKEAARRRFAAGHAGEHAAPARPALGFALDRTSRSEVEAWAAAHGISCTRPRSGADFDCANVTPDLLPEHFRGVPVQSLWLTFGAGERLTSVVAVRRDRSAAAISAAFQTITREVARQAGTAWRVAGDSSATDLSAGLLRQASAEYRFRNYYALARATHMGDGFVLTEEYRSLPN